MKKSWDKRWERTFRTREWGKYPPEELVRFIARNYYRSKSRRKIRILDLGCGTGASTWYIAREGFTTTGIDGSPTAVKIAKKRFAKERVKADLRVGDIVELPFKNEYFQAVTDIGSIQHNSPTNIRKIIAEAHRVLKPGGKFLGHMIAENRALVRWEGTTHYFTRGELRTLFKVFSNVTVDSITRTEGNGRTRIKHWIVEAVK